MNNSIEVFKKNALRAVFGLIIGFSIFFSSLLLISYYKLIELPSTVKYEMLIIGFLFQIMFWLSMSYAWKVVLKISVGHKVKLVKCFIQAGMLLIGKYIPGKVWGMFARGHILSKDNISYQDSLLGTYVEQVISIHAGLSIGIIFWLIAISSDYLAFVIIGVIGSLYIFPRLSNKLFQIYRHIKPNSELNQSNVFKLSIVDYSGMFILYVIGWLLIGAILVSITAAIYGHYLNINLIFLLLGINAIGFVLGFFAFFAPGGIGVREAFIISIIIQYIPLNDSLILVVLFRAWLICADIIVGLLAVYLLQKSHLKILGKGL